MRDLPESALAGLLAVTLMLGFLLTAIAFLRAGIYPRWVGVLWVGACLTFFLSFFGDIFPDSVQRVLGTVSGALFGTPFTLALVCLGVVAWQRVSRQVAGV